MGITLDSDFFQVITKLKFTRYLSYKIISCHGSELFCFYGVFYSEVATVIRFGISLCSDLMAPKFIKWGNTWRASSSVPDPYPATQHILARLLLTCSFTRVSREQGYTTPSV